MKIQRLNIALAFFIIIFNLIGLLNVIAQVDVPKTTTNNIVNSINNYDEARKAGLEKYKYEPYIPTVLDPTLKDPEYVKKRIEWIFKKFVYSHNSTNPAYENEETGLILRKTTNEAVTDDYIRFTSGSHNDYRDTVTIYFKDELRSKIEYFTPNRNGITCYTKLGNHKFCCCISELPDLLFYMQNYYAGKYVKEELERFKTVADNYQTLTEKPAMTEEQRKYILQANALNDNKDYVKAIQYYDKALALNPVSYPEGYYNLALIAGLAGNYPYAILNMKKYLLLLPDAPDARQAQDKIYGWEVFVDQK